jgi:hypothetical protein
MAMGASVARMKDVVENIGSLRLVENLHPQKISGDFEKYG